MGIKMKAKWILYPAVITLLLLAPSIVGAEKTDGPEARYIVTFKENVDPYSVVEREDVELDLGIINGVAMVSTPNHLNALLRTGKVDSVRLDHKIEASVATEYTRLPWGVNWIDADPVWTHETGTKGEDVHVAVLDTGIDLNHPDLVGRIGTGINFVADVNPAGREKSPADPNAYDDDNGHGTHCAGIIAADEDVENNGAIGVARQAILHPVKVLDNRGSGYSSWLIKGIDWCSKTYLDDNEDPIIDVISMSLGSAYGDSGVKGACDYAYNTGNIILVAAAGNSGDGNLATSEVEYPAAYASVISVGAADMYHNIATFSCSNQYVEIAAPGVEIYSTYAGGGYRTMSGTSMACPHVAGTVALMLANNVAFSDIRTQLTAASNVDDIGPSESDWGSGAGLVDALRAVGFSDIYSPMIMGWSAAPGDTSATITFFTDEYADAYVEYWTELSTKTTSSTSSNSIEHTIEITGLTSDTLYYYDIVAEDASDYSGTQTHSSMEFTTTGGSTPSEDYYMHVKSISASTQSRGRNTFLTTDVKIVDDNGANVDGATVYLKISKDQSTVSTSSATTGSDGIASFNEKLTSSGTYTIEVTNVAKDGWTYDSGSNDVTSVDITA